MGGDFDDGSSSLAKPDRLNSPMASWIVPT